MTARKGLIVVNGVEVRTTKKFLWQVGSRVAFADTSWCDADTGNGGNNGPGELVLIRPDNSRTEITEPKQRPEKKDDLASARRHRPHAGERGSRDTH